jgi:16S rRNA (guanine966-N2)-methyltransferase
VREALFMSLEPLNGLRVVDLFAGSGALGIEALSRGAAWVDFAEQDVAALGVLRTNLKELAIADRARVWTLELPHGLKRIEAPLAGADLVLIDPPYGAEIATAVLEALAAPACLPEGCRVAVEHHVRDALPGVAGVVQRVRTRKYGETVVSLYRVMEGARAVHPDPGGES